MVARIGMLSFAHIHAHSYADSLLNCKDQAEFVGIADDNPDRGRDVASSLGVTWFDSPDALLRECDGVVICSENVKHKDFTLQAADAGVHVLCEKPISTTIENARAMIDGCEAAGVQLMIAFPCRYSTSVFRTVELVRQGKLGKILGMRGTNRGTMPGDWFTDRKLAGGGAVMDHTVHVVDVWRWLLGKEVVSVYAEADELFYTEYGIDDTGLLNLEFDGGVIATLDTSWSRPNKSFPTWGDVTLEIVGDQGSISVDAFNQKVEIFNNDAVKGEWACWTDNIDFGLIKAFLQVVEKNEKPPITGMDGLRALEVALGAYQSLETGEPVTLPLK